MCRVCDAPVIEKRVQATAAGITYYEVLCPTHLKQKWKRKNEARVKRKYGVGPAPVGTKCAICGRDGVEMCVDHDHGTGAFRNYLCHKCNRGIGYLCDDPLLVLRAADYLIEHKKRIA